MILTVLGNNVYKTQICLKKKSNQFSIPVFHLKYAKKPFEWLFMFCFCRCLCVLASLLFFLAGCLSREFLGGRAMADDLSRDPDAVGRCPPYATVTSSSTPRFLSAPQLVLLVLSQEHVGTILQEERLMAYPPAASPLAAWLNSCNSEDFNGPLIIFWVFYRHMTLRDPQGRFTYKPNFYVRVTSDRVAPVHHANDIRMAQQSRIYDGLTRLWTGGPTGTPSVGPSPTPEPVDAGVSSPPEVGV